MADEDTNEDRIERLEGSVGRIERMLEQVVGTGSKAHAAAEAHEEKHLDRPSSIEEQVRAELARADEEKKKSEQAESEKSERQTIKDQLAKLTEAKPEAPQPRRQRVMWGSK